MIRSKLFRSGAACLAFLPSPILAQAAKNGPLHKAVDAPKRLQLSGSVRLRYEALTGQFRPGFRRGEDLVNLRSTLFAEYRIGDVRTGGELWDSRVYDVDRGSIASLSEVNAVEPAQAYLAWEDRDVFGRGDAVTVQVGRFILNLGSRRLVAADDYRNTTNGYTGVRADWRGRDGMVATAIYTQPQVRLPDGQAGVLANRVELDRESDALVLWGAIVNKPHVLGEVAGEVTYLRLRERDERGRATRDRDLQTVAARIIREPKAGRVDVEVEGIYQFGGVSGSVASTAPTLDVST